MKVLVVDDDPIIQMTLQSNLKKWGYQPVIAESAEIGWEILQSANAPTLAIIDWKLPKMNGIELCKLIKSQDNTYCYIIMLTGRMSSDDVVVGLESGADDYIVKPVDAAELRARLMSGRRILEKMKSLSSSIHHTTELNQESVSPNNPVENSFSAPKILIAEDDPVSREVLMENLNRWGFSVIVAENGQQALEAFKAHKGPLLGIIDWMMPQLSGIDVCRTIKALSEEGLCYLILLTAKNQRDDIVEGLESGADDYLTKPFHSAELRARVNAGIKVINTNRHLKAIVSNSSEGILTFNSDGVVDSFNVAAEKMFGFKAHEILGKDILTLILNEADKENLKHQITIATAGSSQQCELIGIKKNHRSFPLELNMAQMNYDGNKHFVCIIRDITEQKNYERDLVVAKEVAEHATKAKSQFLSNMSHELRTPLNAILGFAQLLESDTESPLTEDQRESLDYILQGGSHLLGLVNEILDLAKIESGKMVFEYKTVELDTLLWECVSLINGIAVAKEVNISHSATTTENHVRADENRLKQVLLNLLSNAIKYNSQPGNIFIEKSQPETGLVRISITDTGKGISKEKQLQLFQSFNRLGAENSRVEGTGIGLLITKSLIEQMGGAIGFESEVDKGSTFWIQLPIVVSTASN